MTGSGFADLVRTDGILSSVRADGKDDLLVALVEAAAVATGQPASLILERVREREALGSTGFGQGMAIPHARIIGLANVMAVVARLTVPVDYGAPDGEAVDIAVLLLSPEGAGADHLKALARISRSLREPGTLAAMRDANDVAALRDAIGSAKAGQRAA